MTVTAIETTPSAQEPAAPVLTMKGQALWRAVSNAMLFASTDDTLMPINAVRFERSEGGKLELLSTDRYRIFIEEVEHEAGTDAGAFAFSLSLADAKQLTTVLKGAGRIGDVMLLVGEDRLRVTVNDTEFTLRFLDAGFPQFRAAVPKEESLTETAAIMFNVKFLADLGKLKFASGSAAGNPAKFQFSGCNKPVLIRFDDGPTVVQMPVRMAEPEPARETAATQTAKSA